MLKQYYSSSNRLIGSDTMVTLIKEEREFEKLISGTGLVVVGEHKDAC